MTDILTVTVENRMFRGDILKDAQNADDWPVNELHSVVLDPNKLTVEGTPEGIRWLYDWLTWADKSWRLEGQQWMAEDCNFLAEAMWKAIGEDPPERQRPREIRAI